jgi:hypothetical protein
MDEATLVAIETRARAVTSGPWTVREERQPVGDGLGERWPVVVTLAGKVVAAFLTGRRAEAEFVAQAREDVLALVARIRDLETTVRLLENDLQEVGERG